MSSSSSSLSFKQTITKRIFRLLIRKSRSLNWHHIIMHMKNWGLIGGAWGKCFLSERTFNVNFTFIIFCYIITQVSLSKAIFSLCRGRRRSRRVDFKTFRFMARSPWDFNLVFFPQRLNAF